MTFQGALVLGCLLTLGQLIGRPLQAGGWAAWTDHDCCLISQLCLDLLCTNTNAKVFSFPPFSLLSTNANPC